MELHKNKRIEKENAQPKITEVRTSNTPLPLINPETLIGYSFLGEHSGEKQKVINTKSLDNDTEWSMMMEKKEK